LVLKIIESNGDGILVFLVVIVDVKMNGEGDNVAYGLTRFGTVTGERQGRRRHQEKSGQT
jgi:hypothetical protein